MSGRVSRRKKTSVKEVRETKKEKGRRGKNWNLDENTEDAEPHRSILPLDIIKIICDYLDFNAPDFLTMNLDISSTVAKIFGKSFTPRSFFQRSFCRGTCKYGTECRCKPDEKFHFHEHFPEVYIRNAINDGCDEGHGKTVSSAQSTLRNSKFSIEARVSEQFILEQVDKNYIHHFQAISEETLQKYIDDHRTPDYPGYYLFAPEDRGRDPFYNDICQYRKMSPEFLERNKEQLLSNNQTYLARNKHLPEKFILDNAGKLGINFWLHCVHLELSRPYLIKHAAELNLSQLFHREDFELLFVSHFYDHNFHGWRPHENEKFFMGENFFHKYPQELRKFSKHAVISPQFATEYWNKYHGVDKVDIFENPHVGEKFLEQRLAELTRAERQKVKPQLNRNHSLSSDFWDRHLDLVITTGPDSLAKNPNLSVGFIRQHCRGLNLTHVFQYNNQLPNFFIRQTILDFLAEHVL